MGSLDLPSIVDWFVEHVWIVLVLEVVHVLNAAPEGPPAHLPVQVRRTRPLK